MSLWIRSQNKKRIINVNKIELIENFQNIYKNSIWGNDLLLGTYSTEEKALKVLEDIQLALIYANVIIQMPQDDEVNA